MPKRVKRLTQPRLRQMVKSFAESGAIITDLSASTVGATSLAVSGDAQITGSLIVSGCISASCFQVDTLTARTTIEMTQSLHADDYPVFFGTNSDSFIKYDEAASDFMIISGSAKGLVLSGAAISASCDHVTIYNPVEGASARLDFISTDGAYGPRSNSIITDYNGKMTLDTVSLHLLDDIKFYFGTDNDISLEYDENGNDTLSIDGGDVLIEDDHKLYFGSNKDSSIFYNEAAGDYLIISGSSPGTHGSIAITGTIRHSNEGATGAQFLIDHNLVGTNPVGTAPALQINQNSVDQQAIRIADAKNTNQPIIYMESSTTGVPFIKIEDDSDSTSERFCIDIDIDHSSARAGGLKIKADHKGSAAAILVDRNTNAAGAGASPGDVDADDWAKGILVDLDYTGNSSDTDYWMVGGDIDVLAGSGYADDTVYAVGQRITMDGDWPADSSPGVVDHTGLEIGMKDSQYMTHIKLLSGSAATGTLGINRDDFMVISGSNNGMVLSGSTISASCDMFAITGAFKATHHHSSSLMGGGKPTGLTLGDETLPSGPLMFGFTDASTTGATEARQIAVVDVSGSTSGSQYSETLIGVNSYVQQDAQNIAGAAYAVRAVASGSTKPVLGQSYGVLAMAGGSDVNYAFYGSVKKGSESGATNSYIYYALPQEDTSNTYAWMSFYGQAVFNEIGAPESDFRVESDSESHMLFVDAGNNRVSIGDSVDAPAATLEVTNNASAGAYNVPLLQLNSNDVDQIALDINAANTTANVIDITADALTTGKALNIVSDASNTSTRQLVSIKNDHASATGATALYVQNDSTGDGISVLAETNTFMSVDANKPYFYVLNAANDATGPNIIIGNFRNGGGTANSDNDGLGAINFYGYNDAGTPEVTEFAHIRGSVSDASDGTEDGILQLSASHMSFTGTTIKIDSHSTTIGSNEKLFAGYSSVAAGHPLMSGDFIQAMDNAAMFFGSNGDAWMLYDEDHSDQFVISGAVGGTYFSGSSVHVGGAGTYRGQTTYSPSITMPQTAFDTITDFGTVTSDGDAMDFFSDFEGGGQMVRFGSFDSGVTRGSIVSYSTRVWFKADRSDNTGPSSGLNWLGVALASDGSSDEGLVLLRGFIRIDTAAMNNYSGTSQVGMPVYLSTTAGEFDMSVSTTSGDIIRVVGYLIDTDGTDHLIYFCPDNTWIEVA